MNVVLWIVALLALALAPLALEAESARQELQTTPLRGTPAEKLFNRPHAACRAWNDGCISCVHSDAGGVHCTDISVLCTPHEIVCTREQEAEPSRRE
jgi:hypothetical protein